MLRNLNRSYRPVCRVSEEQTKVKIRKISVFQIDLPLSEPYFLSGGRLRFEKLDATFLKLETDNKVIGWGEATPWGHTYLPAHGPGVRAGIATLASSVLGLDPRKIEHVERAMDVCLPGHLYAKAPIDMACWDILGQVTGQSIADALGGRYERGTQVASSISTGTPDEMLDRVKRYRSRGYQVHSAKVGGDIALDLSRIDHLEKNRLPNEHMLFDANRSWSRREAIIVMNALPGLGVTFEQPVETIDDIAAIRPLTKAAISIDEALHTVADMTRIVSCNLAEAVNIKLNRVGGLTKARRIRDIALAHGIQCYVMATGGSVLADTEAAHLAQTIPETFRLGSWACQDMLTVDVAPGQGARSIEGVLTVDSSPGLGVAPDEDLLGTPVATYEL